LPDFFQVYLPVLGQAPCPLSWPNVIFDPVTAYFPRTKIWPLFATVYVPPLARFRTQFPLNSAGLLIVVAYLPASVPLAEGRTNLGIARRLWLTKRTVETHITSILAKLGLGGGEEDHRRVLAVLAFLNHRRTPGTLEAQQP
jgi:regulatory LuxR family protein